MKQSRCQIPVTWSRLFHIRKTLWLAYKSSTHQSTSNSDEISEEKDGTSKQSDFRHSEGQNRVFERERRGFSYGREGKNIDRQGIRHRKDFTGNGMSRNPEFDVKVKSFVDPKFRRRNLIRQDIKEEELEIEEDSAYKFRAVSSYFQDEALDSTQEKRRWSGSKNKAKQWPRRKPGLPRDWSETFGTLTTTETDPTLQDMLYGEGPTASRDSEPDLEEISEEDDDDEEDRPHIPLSRRNRRHIPNWYARRIQKFGKQGMVKEAIEVFDKWMIERDRVKPTHFEYGVLITLLGKAGYTDKAFNLLYKMQTMDLVPEGKVFTSLFNACAKSPFKERALKKASRLHWSMIEQGIEPSLITYKAMINAFGICGDMETAFSLIDEALQRYRPDETLLSSALVACVSDKEAGFRHAIQVWWKFLKRGVKPDVRSHNLLLRAVKECGVGPLTADNNLILIEAGNQDQEHKRRQKKIVSSLQLTVDPHDLSSGSVVEVIEGVGPEDSIKNFSRQYEVNYEAKKEAKGHASDLDFTERELMDKTSTNTSAKHWWELDQGKPDTKEETPVGKTFDKKAFVEKTLVKQSLDEKCPTPVMMPDLLNPFDKSLQMVTLGWVQTHEHRLSLVGGLQGFLSNLEKYGEKPDIITFTQLITVVPASEEDQVLDMMALYDVEPDIDFFNHLIDKKAQRWDKTGALEVQNLIEERNLVPNIRTYGCLAKACSKYKDGLKLLNDMEKANMSPNTTVMQILMKASGFNFSYKAVLLQHMKKQDIKASSVLIERIEKDISSAKDIIVRKEQGKEVPEFFKHESYDTNFERFMDYYTHWLKVVQLKKPEHPWSEYRDSDDMVKDSAKQPETRARRSPVHDNFSRRHISR